MAHYRRNGVEYYIPDKKLVYLVRQELHRRKEIETGIGLAEDEDSHRKRINAYRRKVHHMEKIFQAVADLTFLFEAIAKHPELEKLYEDIVKDLLGVRREKPTRYGFMLHRLLRSILIIGRKESEEKRRSKETGGKENMDRENDYRLRLNHILQDVVFDKAKPYLLDALKTEKAEEVVSADFHKAWAWTGMLAYNTFDNEEDKPDRTFKFSTVGLLK